MVIIRYGIFLLIGLELTREIAIKSNSTNFSMVN